ncbi:MAG: hypothetical protein AAFY99_02740 [Pseudomonadota bacterium]
MSPDVLFGPVDFNGGAIWNPLTSSNDQPGLMCTHALLDVALALRGSVPNLSLGLFDEYIWAGENELALFEIEEFIAKNQEKSNTLAEKLLARVRPIWEHAENLDKLGKAEKGALA